MHPYVPHLLKDIVTTHYIEPEFAIPEKKSDNPFQDVEDYLDASYPHTLGYYCGLSEEDFPPAEVLSNSDMKKIIKAFEKMLFTYNHTIDFPKRLPVVMRYQMTIETLNDKTFIPKYGIVGFDRCSGSPEICVFKEYCSCLKHLGNR